MTAHLVPTRVAALAMDITAEQLDDAEHRDSP